MLLKIVKVNFFVILSVTFKLSSIKKINFSITYNLWEK